MATTHTSTIEARCVKQHTCVCCGAVYTYELHRKVSGTGGTAEKASANARAAIARAMETGVDPIGCPTCGLLQPDMVAQLRGRRLGRVFWFGLIGFAVIVLLRVTFAIQANVAVWAAVATCAAVAAALLLIDLDDPNRNPEANRQASEGRVAAGEMMHRPGRRLAGPHELMRFPRSAFHKLTLLLILVAVVATAAPEVVRATHGWAINPECYPPVVGPGDRTRIYMADKITSVKGYWRGNAAVVVGEPGGRKFPVIGKTNDNNWGDSISAKSSEKNSSSTPWVEVPIPDDAALAGKAVSCDVRLKVEYPKLSGTKSFETTAEEMTRNVPISLASAGAGGTYNDWWWSATVGGMAGVLVFARFLISAARSLGRTALPTQLLVPTAPVA